MFRPSSLSLNVLLGLLMLQTGATVWAQSSSNSGGIFTCTDSRGRRLTSDRPITECLDREQRELGNSGLVKRVVPPSYTAEERARLEAQKKAEDAQLARAAEEKRRDRALLVRYPTLATHEKERSEALAQIDEVINAVKKRSESFNQQRKDNAAELEFYQNDLNKAPSWLKRKVDDLALQEQVQRKFLNEQFMEKQRISARFDEELVKLKQLWSQGVLSR
jgi:hypothetical protein